MSRSATARVQTPGAFEPEVDQIDTATATPEEMAAQIADLKAKLAAQTAENAAAKLPQVVYEPETPHGSVALRSSPTGHLTVAQVQAEIDAKRMPEPITSYLCRDGYLARRV
jgi:DNA segregation ATPase FtsK/SpoIIIE-like protein